MDGGASLLQRARATRHAFEDAVGVLADGRALNDLIRPLQERGRDRETESPGGLEVDHQLELRRLLDREVSRLRSSQDFVYIVRCVAVRHACGYPIAEKKPARHATHKAPCRKTMPDRQLGNLGLIPDAERS